MMFPRLLPLLALLSILPAAAEPADSSGARPQETCKELLDRVRASDCARPFNRWLAGSSLLAGVTMSAGTMDLTINDDPLATMVAVASPSAYFNLSSPARYFGRLPLGWETGLSYTQSTAIYQDLRPESDHVKDLGTYASSTFISVSPSLFLGIGAHDDTPRRWSRIGLGLGAGWAWVHGSAFITQDTVDDVNRSCYDAASALIDGTGTKAQLRSACALETFSEKGFGESMRFFVDGRLGFLYTSVSAEGLFLDGKDYEFFPMQVALRLAYILDL